MSNTSVHPPQVSSVHLNPAISGRKRPRRRRSIIRKFSLSTSTHGLPSIAQAESIPNRIFWSISFIGFTGIMIYLIVKAIIDYFQYPTSMDVSYDYEWPLYFPAFSFCNLASLRFDLFIKPFLNYTNALNWTNTNDTTTISSYQANLIRNFLVDIVNKNQSLAPFSFSLSSMLYMCAYNYVPCSAADFISFTSATYGQCYTFNAKLKNSTDGSVRYDNMHGGPGLLSLGLYVYSNQYVPYTIDAAGVLVLVHDNTQLPPIETSGVELAPGMRHKLSFTKKRVDFLSSPYTDCTNRISPTMEAMFNNYHGADYAYSEAICYELCQQSYAYEQCGCIDPYLWNARSIILPGTNKVNFAPLCNLSNICYGNAVESLFNSSSLLEKYCSDCSSECSMTSFIVQLSSSRGLLEWQIDSIKTFVENSSVPLPVNWSSTWRDDIHQNYLVVNLQYGTNLVEINTQSSVIGVVDVISNIGGQTGLWIGLSFLALMEVIEMVYHLIRHEFDSMRQAILRKTRVMT